MRHLPFQKIIDAVPLRNWRVLVVFATGERRIYDMTWILSETGSMALPFRDQAFFSQVRVENDTLVWPNGADLDSGVVYAESVPEELAATIEPVTT